MIALRSGTRLSDHRFAQRRQPLRSGDRRNGDHRRSGCCSTDHAAHGGLKDGQSGDTMSAKISDKDRRKALIRIEGPLPVVNGVSFARRRRRVRRHSRPSGCGKSTLMSIIAGFDRPDQVGLIDGVGAGDRVQGHPHLPAWLRISVAHGATEPLFRSERPRLRRKEELADHYAAIVGLKRLRRAIHTNCRAACSNAWNSRERWW